MKTPADECRARFAAARILRLATADSSGQPHIVPATFTLDGDTIGIAIDHKPKTTANLKRLRNIAENPAVALLVDHYSNDWEQLWWARADGDARVLKNELAGRLVELLLNKYSQYRRNRPVGPVIEIQVTRWSGWSYASR